MPSLKAKDEGYVFYWASFKKEARQFLKVTCICLAPSFTCFLGLNSSDAKQESLAYSLSLTPKLKPKLKFQSSVRFTTKSVSKLFHHLTQHSLITYPNISSPN